jgi:hypothetical protein
MGHPTVDNRTPFACETTFAADEEGCPLVVSLVQGTYRIEKHGQLALAEKQFPVNLAGQYHGRPEDSSCKYEPQFAFMKPATDVVLVGSAYPRRNRDTEVIVSLYVGSVQKTIRVVGNRHWDKTLGMAYMSPPEPFESIPLTYENAFGGWDRSNPDQKKHSFEPRNPVGTGFRGRHGKFEVGIRLPNLEDPEEPIRSYGDMPPPAGFGFTSPNWHPRVEFAGTYDEAWMRDRMPLLPKDFDRRFFNSASPGLVAPDYLEGNEQVLIENASPSGLISFNLPAAPPPSCRVELKGGQAVNLETKLDTVIINTDETLLFLVWRAYTQLKSGPHDVVSIEIKSECILAPALS